jgi:hypothetical protein
MIRAIPFKNVEGEEIFTTPAIFLKKLTPYHFFRPIPLFYSPTISPHILTSLPRSMTPYHFRWPPAIFPNFDNPTTFVDPPYHFRWPPTISPNFDSLPLSMSPYHLRWPPTIFPNSDHPTTFVDPPYHFRWPLPPFYTIFDPFTSLFDLSRKSFLVLTFT